MILDKAERARREEYVHRNYCGMFPHWKQGQPHWQPCHLLREAHAALEAAEKAKNQIQQNGLQFLHQRNKAMDVLEAAEFRAEGYRKAAVILAKRQGGFEKWTKEAEEALRSLATDALGWGEGNVGGERIQWPLRDELLSRLSDARAGRKLR
jgi:hypothetical protein